MKNIKSIMFVLLSLLSIVVYPDVDQFYSLLTNAKLKPIVMLFIEKGTHRASKIWEKVAARFDENRKVIIAEFSCHGRRDFCWSNGVKQVPAIQCHFGPDIVVPYLGMLKTDDIVEWIDRMIEKPVHELTWPPLLDEKSVSFVLAPESKHLSTLTKVAYAFKNTTNKFYTGNITHSLTAIYDDTFNVTISDDLSDESIADFVWKNQFQLVEELTFHNFHIRRSTRRYMLVAAIDRITTEQQERFQKILQQLRRIAKDNFQDVGVTWADGQAMAPHLEGYGISTFPAVVVLDNQLRQEFFFSTSNFENLEQWMLDIKKGVIEVHCVPLAKRLKMLVMFVCVRYTLVVVVVIILLITFIVTLRVFVRELRELRRRERDWYRRLEEKKES